MNRTGSKRLGVIFFLSLWMGLLACYSSPRVIISTKGGKELVLKVEVADTPEKRVLGLQYRSELSDDQGMLFLFPSESVQSFWMKNTPLSLDMIFIGGDLRIVGIIHQAVPFSITSRSVSAPSRFVLEVQGGLSRQKGIEVDDTVRFENISLEGIKE